MCYLVSLLTITLGEFMLAMKTNQKNSTSFQLQKNFFLFKKKALDFLLETNRKHRT